MEFLEYGERQTKTRLGDDTNDVRPIAPKMFSLPNSDRCPVLTYKVFAEKRPTQMNFDEAPFYLAVNNIKTDSLDKKPWFKQSPVGVNKFNSIMKVISEKAELNKPRLKNHSGRKTMMQTLVNVVLFRDSLLSRPEKGPEPRREKRESCITCSACSERANHIALDTRVDKWKMGEPQNLETWKLRESHVWTLLCALQCLENNTKIMPCRDQPRKKKPDRIDVGELLPHKCNDWECTTITFVFVARR